MMGQVAIFHGPGTPFELANFPTPEPNGGEVLVRITCCTLCRSDLHTHAGHRREATPSVLGHETVGRIERLGPEARRTDFRKQPLNIGDLITWSDSVSCGRCLYCDERIPQKCVALQKYGHQRFSPNRPFTGGLATHILLDPGTAIVRVADSVPVRIAALSSCALASAASALREIGIMTHRSVLIFGAGVFGLSAAALARTMGVKVVAVCEPDEGRRERALAFGATEVFRLDDVPSGRFDVVLEMAGTTESVQAAIAAPRVGGTVVLAGTVQHSPKIMFDPESIVRRMTTIMGVHNYTPIDLAESVSFLEVHAKAFPFHDLVGPTFSLQEVDRAFAHGRTNFGTHVAVVSA